MNIDKSNLSKPCAQSWLCLSGLSSVCTQIKKPQTVRSCPLQKRPELPSSSQKEFTSYIPRVSRGYKSNNISNLVHRMTYKNMPCRGSAHSPWNSELFLCLTEFLLSYWLYSLDSQSDSGSHSASIASTADFWPLVLIMPTI